MTGPNQPSPRYVYSGPYEGAQIRTAQRRGPCGARCGRMIVRGDRFVAAGPDPMKLNGATLRVCLRCAGLETDG